MVSPSSYVGKFFSSVPAFSVGRAGAAASHVILQDDELPDETAMNIIRSRLDEANRSNVVLQRQLDDAHIGWLVSSWQLDMMDVVLDEYDELYLAQRHALEQSQIIAGYVDQDMEIEVVRIRARILLTLNDITPLRYPDHSPILAQKPPIPTDEQRDVAIELGCFEKGGRFKGYRLGKEGPGGAERTETPLHVMTYDCRSDWRAVHASFGGRTPTFNAVVEALAKRNKGSRKRSLLCILRLKATLLPMLQEEGLHIQERHAAGSHTKELDSVLVDYGVLLLNGKPHPHGYRLDYDMNPRIKVDLQDCKEACREICRRSFTFLARESFRKKR